METFFPYEIPVWHPILVHFPIAFILAGALAASLWSLRASALWRQIALFLFTLGVAGGLGAYFTGEAMEEQAEGTPIVEELVELHESAALYTLIVAGAVLLGLAVVSVWQARQDPSERRPDPLSVRLVLALLALAAAALVAWTGHLGGSMVWGVG